MKRFFLLFLLLPLFAHSQVLTGPVTDTATVKKDTVRYWKRGGMIGFSFTQSSYTNWAAGGVNSVSGQGLFNLFANYKKDSLTWDNNLDLGYGLLQQGKTALLRKTDDKIDFSSKYGHYAFGKVWYYSTFVGFKTQFQPGYTYYGDTAQTLISDFMSPAYLIIAEGLDYKPNPKFSMLIAPVTGRMTFVTNQTLADSGAFGVERAVFDDAGNKVKDGRNVRYEFGGYLRAQYKSEIMKNVVFTSRLELFTNYLNNPQNIDVNAEVLLTLKVNKFLSATFNMQAIYDHDINIAVDTNHDGVADGSGPRLQFRQVMAIGFAAKF